MVSLDTVLLTKRTVVRRLRETDGSALSTLFLGNETLIYDYFPTDIDMLHADQRPQEYARLKLAAWLLREEYCFGIWDNEAANMIGFVQLTDLNTSVSKAQLRFFLDRESSGQGLMTEALMAVLEFAFRQLMLNKLGIYTATDNYTVQRLARKLGFQREGILREEMPLRAGDMADLMVFGLTRREYHA